MKEPQETRFQSEIGVTPPKTLGELFIGFLSIGARSFGGVLPWAYRTMVEERRWMTHADFVAAYQRGAIRVEIEPQGAARLLSGRLLLPLVAMPVLGLGVALALIGWIATGVALIAVGFIVPRLIKRSAPQFLLQQALRDPATYDELSKLGLLRIAQVAGNA